MILVDFSQIAYSCAIEYLIMSKESNIQVDLVRHMILNTLRSHVKKNKKEYGEVVIAVDSDTYWRKEHFPHYKARRKKNRDNSQFNWDSIFQATHTLKAEFKKFLPYRIIEIDGAEADDIIGTLTLSQPMGAKVLILSGDKDFVQLQSCLASVTQKSPLTKEFITEPLPQLALKSHIIRGDVGDGIPNILSPDDVFVSGGRQKPILEKKLLVWMQQSPSEFCATEDILRNYKRNEQLIDLTKIPKPVSEKILNYYKDTPAPATKAEFVEYLATSGLRELTSSAGDF